jgi:acetyltransferase-like isoleucine patch superfamily enzyme
MQALKWIGFARRARDKMFTWLASGSFLRLGSRTTLAMPVRLGGEKFIEIGDRVYVGPGSWIETMIDDGWEPKGAVISIGSGTSMSGNCTITAVRRVEIGRNVLIARNVHISDHFHAFEDRNVPVKDQGIDRIAEVMIHDGAWIGHGAVVCPGVTIGKNAVIGANAVVREDVPDFCVAAGVPARIIRRAGTAENISTSP